MYNKFDFKHYVKIEKNKQHFEIEEQLKKAEEYRSISTLYDNDIDDDNGNDDWENDHDNVDDDQILASSFEKSRQSTTYPQAIYTSRLLNPFTKNLLKYDDSECLSCAIMTEKIIEKLVNLFIYLNFASIFLFKNLLNYFIFYQLEIMWKLKNYNISKIQVV